MCLQATKVSFADDVLSFEVKRDISLVVVQMLLCQLHCLLETKRTNDTVNCFVCTACTANDKVSLINALKATANTLMMQCCLCVKTTGVALLVEQMMLHLQYARVTMLVTQHPERD